MDFIDWCGLVLNKLIEAGRDPHIDEIKLAQILYGEDTRVQPEFWHSKLRRGMLDAVAELVQLGLVAERGGRFWSVTVEGREIASDPMPLWETICDIKLGTEEERILRVTNHNSPRIGSSPDHAWLEYSNREPLLAEFEVTADMEMLKVLWPVSEDLASRGLVYREALPGFHLNLKSTYRGLVWETRQGFTTEARFIDDLVAVWETTCVDFKRELYLDTADQKAEFAKDILGLANTQAGGRRWLIIGFDDRTRVYHGPPDLRVNQNRIEQILAQLTTPHVDVRYEIVDYRGNQLGKLEVLRDSKKLPYSVAKSIGDKKRLTAGQIFVRHGSQTEMPTAAELQAIQYGGDRARALEP